MLVESTIDAAGPESGGDGRRNRCDRRDGLGRNRLIGKGRFAGVAPGLHFVLQYFVLEMGAAMRDVRCDIGGNEKYEMQN